MEDTTSSEATSTETPGRHLLDEAIKICTAMRAVMGGEKVNVITDAQDPLQIQADVSPPKSFSFIERTKTLLNSVTKILPLARDRVPSEDSGRSPLTLEDDPQHDDALRPELKDFLELHKSLTQSALHETLVRQATRPGEGCSAMGSFDMSQNFAAHNTVSAWIQDQVIAPSRPDPDYFCEITYQFSSAAGYSLISMDDVDTSLKNMEEAISGGPVDFATYLKDLKATCDSALVGLLSSLTELSTASYSEDDIKELRPEYQTVIQSALAYSLGWQIGQTLKVMDVSDQPMYE